MKTFFLLTKLSPRLSEQMRNRDEVGRAWLDEVKEKCPEVRFVGHYGLLGRYDFVDIYEAPDEEVAAKVSMISRASGAFMAESLPAIPYKRLVELSKEI
jgi:uncharacterized protein with GYD domain